MALVTDRIVENVGAYIDVTYDDVTFRLSSVYAHTADVPVVLRIYKRNGDIWKEVALEPQTDVTYPLPAGPIRYLEDIPTFGLL